MASTASISSFTAGASRISVGGSTTLSWTVSGASSLSIDNGVGAVAVNGASITVTPSTTTTYTLTATNAAGASVTATATVNVIPTAVISSFTASKSTITSGSSVALKWAVNGATSVSIDNGVGSVSGSSVTVTPTAASTTYTLTAVNAAGQTDTATVTIATVAAPSISASVVYNGTPAGTGAAAMTAGAAETATINWAANSATTSVQLDGVTQTASSATVQPTATKAYTLTATNAAGDSAYTNVVVNVEALPVITSFAPDQSTVPYGNGATLVWAASNAAASTVNGTAVSGNSMSTGNLTTTTQYQLICTNHAGDTSSQTVSVTVVPAVSLTSDASNISANGAGTTLRWTANGASSLQLYSYLPMNGQSTATEIADVSSVSSYAVNPTAETVYFLKASNAAGGSANSLPLTLYVTSELQDIVSFLGYNTSTPSNIAVSSTAVNPATNVSAPVYLIPYFVNSNSADSANTVDTATITDEAGNSYCSPVTSGAACAVTPNASTNYTLTVTNSSYSPAKVQKKTLRVIVGNITNFSGEGLPTLVSTSGYSSTSYYTNNTGSTLSAASSYYTMPTALAVSPNGMVYLADTNLSCSIIKLNPDGGSALYAGTPGSCITSYTLDTGYGYGVDASGNILNSANANLPNTYGNQAVSSAIKLSNGVWSFVADSAENVYMGDPVGRAIDIISGGLINTVVGNSANTSITTYDGTGTSSGAANLPTSNFTGSASLWKLTSVVTDSYGEVIFADTYKIRVMDKAYKVTTLVYGGGSSVVDGYGANSSTTANPNNVPALYPKAYVTTPVSLSIDPATDTVYFIDQRAIRKMVPDKSTGTATCHAACWTWTVTTWINAQAALTVPTSSTAYAKYVDGPASRAVFFSPVSMARAADGTLFVAEGYTTNSAAYPYEYIRRITPDGTVDTIAGNGLCATASTTGCTLPNSLSTINGVTGIKGAEPLPGVTYMIKSLAADTTKNRLLFTVSDTNSVYQMPY